MQVARLVDRAANSSSGGAGQASGPERRDHLVLGDRVGRQQLRPGPLLGPELAQAQLAAVLEPDQHPRGPVFRRGPLVEDPQPPRRHQVDQQGQVAELDHRHLADPPHPGHSRPTSASSGGSKVFITFIPGASADSTVGAGQRGVEPARGDLDLGQLGHATRRSWRVSRACQAQR